MKGWNATAWRLSQVGFSWRKIASALCSLTALLGCLTGGALSAHAQLFSNRFIIYRYRPHPDFNGDGYADLPIGVPNESYTWHNGANIVGAGIVQVVYGSPGGLAYGMNQLYSRQGETSGSIFHPTAYGAYGASLAWGDFNKDGYDDLASGVPGDNGGQGTVEIYNGTPNGLYYAPSLRMTQPMMRAPLAAGRQPMFGNVLAVGDVNGDGFADLAIAVVADGISRGGAYIVPGSATGLKPSASQTWSYPGMGPTSLALGDFNGDGCSDLAMGYPYHFVNNKYAGEVIVAFGTPYGLDSIVQSWSQDSPGVPDACEDNDKFGMAMVAADFNGDGTWDLAIGAPGEDAADAGVQSGRGVAHVLFGRAGVGLVTVGTQIFGRTNTSRFDRFGTALAAMDVDSDGRLELIVGIPGDKTGAGGIQVISVAALRPPINAFFSQDTDQVLGDSEPGDRFGSALALGDFNGDGKLDLAIGVPGENNNAGAVNILFGTGNGLSWPNNEMLMQGLQGMQETPEAGDFFGQAL